MHSLPLKKSNGFYRGEKICHWSWQLEKRKILYFERCFKLYLKFIFSFSWSRTEHKSFFKVGDFHFVRHRYWKDVIAYTEKCLSFIYLILILSSLCFLSCFLLLGRVIISKGDDKHTRLSFSRWYYSSRIQLNLEKKRAGCLFSRGNMVRCLFG